MEKVLYVASEAVPFIKTGGLGDVAGTLPKELVQAGIDARLVIPLYKSMKDQNLESLKLVHSFVLTLSWRQIFCSVYMTVQHGVTAYFIDNDRYFYRDSIYGDYDDGERFAFFSKAVLEMLPYIDFFPDVIHINDWQTGFLPLMLKVQYSDRKEYDGIRTLYTIHNIEYQGCCDRYFLGDVLGISDEYMGLAEFDGQLNAMKTGIEMADRVSTVSPTYALEIQHAFFGFGLQDVLRRNHHKLCGIINGIDNSGWNPVNDAAIAHNFSSDTLNEKAMNKLALQQELGLKQDENACMIGLISRLVPAKGIDLITCVLDEMMKANIQFVVLGTGDTVYENLFRSFAEKYPQTLSVNILFDGSLARRIYASSDMLLVPSLSEPCGLTQMIAMRYGTIPIVRAVGGLKDTVENFDSETEQGNGFMFGNYNAHEMLACIWKGLALFQYDRLLWDKIRTNAMAADHSWNKPVEQYIELYSSME